MVRNLKAIAIKSLV